MIDKLKNVMVDRKTISLLSEANNQYTVKPFLFGCQIDYRLFGNYIFIKNSVENKTTLSKRKFLNFKESLSKQVKWNLKDEIFDNIASDVQYNQEFNIVITMIPESIWESLNKTINIAEKTTKDINVQRKLIINTFSEMEIS